MSTLDINAIRDYLLKVGCKIEYPILVHSFKPHLCNPDPKVQAKIRTQFKDYVNSLATVCLENNKKFIVLRPEFKPENLQQAPSQQQASPPPPPVQTPIFETTPPRESSANIYHLRQHAPVPSPYTTPRTTQPPPQRAPNRAPYHQQQQVVAPPPVPQHHKDTIDGQQQRQVVLTPSTNGHKRHIASQQTIDHYQQPPIHSPPRQLSHHNSPASTSMPPPPPPPQATRRQQLSLQRPESLNLTTNGGPTNQMPPPRPPPRRRQSSASLFKPSPKPVEKLREIHDLAKKIPGRVKEHALKLNSSFTLSSIDLINAHNILPMRSNTMKENRLSRDSSIGGGNNLSSSACLQRNGSHLTTRSRFSHREDESDSSSLQPIDPLRRKWAIEACKCNYNGLLTLLREDPKLASYKDIVNGYTALHWAAKFGNLDIIKLIAGTHGVSANIKSSAGYTPLHVAIMFNRNEAANLLLRSYKANPDIRDHSGKRAMQYANAQSSSILVAK